MKKPDNLKRIIVDFKKLTPEILKLLVDKYPEGYDDDNIIKFRNVKNEWIEAVEVTTIDTKYLVKVSTKLVKTMENYEDDFNDDSYDSDQDSIIEPIED
ncbi:hypothetical protein [Olleya sp. R77988]|uniref:hypothetical protein n=1 Tax=Olleya sp. R77988 TaxID=3093875 RepID=UPI0037C5280C